MSPHCSKNAWTLIIAQTSPDRCLLQAKRFLDNKSYVLTCRRKIRYWVLAVELDHKVPVLLVDYGSLGRILPIEELWHWVFFNLMDLLHLEPFCCSWWYCVSILDMLSSLLLLSIFYSHFRILLFWFLLNHWLCLLFDSNKLWFCFWDHYWGIQFY